MPPRESSSFSSTAPITIALIGRPNVGKSTLFNRLIRRQHALVDDQPGVTRDRLQGEARLGDLRVRVIDTPGLEWPLDNELRQGMWQQSMAALDEADVAVFMVDGRDGVLPYEIDLVRQLRRRNTPILLVANKCERRPPEHVARDAARMGFDNWVALSAAHGNGLSDFWEEVRALRSLTIPDSGLETAAEDCPTEEGDGDESAAFANDLSITILGRPNAGKSTLMNKLLGHERVLTGAQPGLTRDAIAEIWTDGVRRIHLVDTAGVRRRSRITDTLEKRSVRESFRSLQFCNVALLVIDAQQPLEKQDLLLGQKVIDEGRGLIVVVNKWDTVENPDALREELQYMMAKGLSVRNIPLLTISALTGRNVNKIFECAWGVYDLWQKRVTTGELNAWLARATQHHPPPQQGQRRVRIKYITQIKARPPTFALFVNRSDVLDESYLRYLRNDLAKTFALEGVPLRIIPRASANPYATASR